MIDRTHFVFGAKFSGSSSETSSTAVPRLAPADRQAGHHQPVKI